MNVYAIIVSFNGIEYIKQCLKHLTNELHQSRIIIIDNSTDNVIYDFIKIQYAQITLIKAEVNLGFGKANNIGIEIASKNGASHFLLINQDVYISKGCVSKLYSTFENSGSGYGIISPMHLNGKGTSFDNNFFSYINGINQMWSSIFLGRPLLPLYEVPFINAACWFMGRNCIESVGGFDPYYHVYGEDNDYLNRLHYKNLKIGICPDLTIYHDRGPQNGLHKMPLFDRLLIGFVTDLKNLNKSFENTENSINRNLSNEIEILEADDDIERALILKKLINELASKKHTILESREEALTSQNAFLHLS